MLKFIFLILMISFVSAVDVDFDCQDDIFVNDEFECSIGVSNGNGKYDIKIDLDGDRNSILEIWNGEVWKSGYYYLKEFIESGEEKNVRLRISEMGKHEGKLKLRQENKKEFFDIEMCVRPKTIDDKEQKIEIEEEHTKNINDEILILNNEKPDIILLNSFKVENNTEELVYVSKDGRIVDWLPYVFSLFLIVLIGILAWERF